MTPKPSCHEVMSGTWVPTKDDWASNRLPGFGVITTFIINGDKISAASRPRDKCGNQGWLPLHRTLEALPKCDPGQN